MMINRKGVTGGVKYDILRRLEEGVTRSRVAAQFGLPRARVAQIANEYEIYSPPPPRRRYRSDEDLPVTDVPIYDRAGKQAFILTFYGVHCSEFARVPDGFDHIRSALERRGLSPDEYWAQLLTIRPARSVNRAPTVVVSDGEEESGSFAG